MPAHKFTDKEQARRVEEILERLSAAYPDARCALEHRSPLELLVATILSAQCTDERVNIVTRELFRKYRTPEDYARVPPEVLEKDIRSTGFFRNKAKSIRAASQMITEQFGGQVPDSMEKLIQLPESRARQPTSSWASPMARLRESWWTLTFFGWRGGWTSATPIRRKRSKET